jgi:hypothetical protein
MPNVPRRYAAFLLRLWQAGDGDQAVWRASLESPDTKERRGFVCLQDLFGFLQALTGPEGALSAGDPAAAAARLPEES